VLADKRFQRLENCGHRNGTEKDTIPSKINSPVKRRDVTGKNATIEKWDEEEQNEAIKNEMDSVNGNKRRGMVKNESRNKIRVSGDKYILRGGKVSMQLRERVDRASQ